MNLLSIENFLGTSEQDSNIFSLIQVLAWLLYQTYLLTNVTEVFVRMGSFFRMRQNRKEECLIKWRGQDLLDEKKVDGTE